MEGGINGGARNKKKKDREVKKGYNGFQETMQKSIKYKRRVDMEDLTGGWGGKRTGGQCKGGGGGGGNGESRGRGLLGEFMEN